MWFCTHIASTTGHCSGEDGQSWDTAYKDLQSCLDDIRDNKPDDVSQGEIWVATGTYTPSEAADWADGTDPQFYSFIMYDNTSLYGGFDGTETSRNSRDWRDNPSYLSCNITDDFGSNIVCSNILLAAMNTIVDGFVFKDAKYVYLDPTRRRLGEYSKNGVGAVISDTTGGRGAGIQSNATNVVVVNNLFTNIVAQKGFVYVSTSILLTFLVLLCCVCLYCFVNN